MADLTLAAILAQAMEHEVIPRCPKCGAHLTTTVTVYPTVRVSVKAWADGQARALYGKRILERKRDLERQVAENYATLDERDEIYCERAPECDFWTTPAQLEIEVGNQMRKRFEEEAR